MDYPAAVAFTAFADVWPMATETGIGAALCTIGAGRTLTLTFEISISTPFYLLQCNLCR